MHAPAPQESTADRSADHSALAPRLGAELVAAGAVTGWLFLWCRTPLALMRAATGCGRGRALLLALYLPAHWLMMALLVVASGGAAVVVAHAVLESLF